MHGFTAIRIFTRNRAEKSPLAVTGNRGGATAGCHLVFPSHRLTPFDPSNVRTRVLAKGLKKAGLRHVTWHSIRHSAASLMAEARASEKEIQVILGHSSIQVTKDLYTHVFDKARAEAVDRMTDHLLAKKPNPDQVEEDSSEYNTSLTAA